MSRRLILLLTTVIFTGFFSTAQAWDHPGHMVTAAIAATAETAIQAVIAAAQPVTVTSRWNSVLASMSSSLPWWNISLNPPPPRFPSPLSSRNA